MVYHYLSGLRLSNPASTFLAHGYLMVDLFFVLSGFVMALNYSKMFKAGWSRSAFKKFLGRRIARVYPLYAVTTAIALILVLSGLLEQPKGYLLKPSAIWDLLMIQSWGICQSLNPPAWSISAEWAAYLFFPILSAVFLFGRPYKAIAGLMLCAAVIGTLCLLPQEIYARPQPERILDMAKPTFGVPVFRCLAEFSLGLIAFRLAGMKFGIELYKSRWAQYCTAAAFVALMATPRADFLVVLLLPILILALRCDTHMIGRVLASPLVEWIGRLSYSLYLVHYMMVKLVGFVHGRADSFGLKHGATYGTIVAVLLTFVCSYFAYRLVEIPGRKWLRSVFENNPIRQPIAAEPSAP